MKVHRSPLQRHRGVPKRPAGCRVTGPRKARQGPGIRRAGARSGTHNARVCCGRCGCGTRTHGHVQAHTPPRRYLHGGPQPAHLDLAGRQGRAVRPGRCAAGPMAGPLAEGRWHRDGNRPAILGWELAVSLLDLAASVDGLHPQVGKPPRLLLYVASHKPQGCLSCCSTATYCHGRPTKTSPQDYSYYCPAPRNYPALWCWPLAAAHCCCWLPDCLCGWIIGHFYFV